MTKKMVGLLIIIAGALILCANLDIIVIKDVFDVVLSLGIMIIGLTGLIERKRFDFLMMLFVIFGALFFSVSMDFISSALVEQIVWPVVIIVIGLSVVFSSKKKIVTDKPVTNYTAIFSGIEDKNISKSYVSSDVTAIFGGAEIDYRNIKLKEDIGYINVTAIFGGVTIFVPENVHVIVKGLPIFGGAENTASVNEAGKELLINYTAIFGGVEIKN